MTDDQFRCERCGYSNKYKSGLLRHLQNARPCAATRSSIDREELVRLLATDNRDRIVRSKTCQRCGKTFASRQSRYQHVAQRRCHVVRAEIAARDMRTEIDELTERIGRLESMMGALASRQQEPAINYTPPNKLGSETSFATDAELSKLMVAVLRDRTYGLCRYLESKHFSATAPQNRNVRKHDRADAFMEYYDGRNWRTKFAADAVEDVLSLARRDIDRFVSATLVDNPRKLRRTWLDAFVEHVAAPLDWDISNDNYEQPDAALDATTKIERKRSIHELLLETIHRRTVEPLSSAAATPVALSRAQSVTSM
jgi:uncharacterized C2H2 Zn-finger protein